MGTAADSTLARQRLLDAACQAFAENGYERATVRDICARAKTNVASVNYHFGSKRELYAQVLRLVELPVEPPDGLLAGNETKYRPSSSEERLFGFISFFLASTLGRDEPTWTAQVLANGLANPTDLLDELVREAIRPHFSRLRKLIASMLGPGVSRQTVDDHSFGVVSQVVFYRHSRPIIERLTGRKYGTKDMDRLARHIFDSVVASLEQERSRSSTSISLDTESLARGEQA